METSCMGFDLAADLVEWVSGKSSRNIAFERTHPPSSIFRDYKVKCKHI